MSTGSMPAYFHPQPEGREVRVSRGLARDRFGRTTLAAAPSWTIQHGDTAGRHQTIEAESIYVRSPYVGGGSLQLQHLSTDVVSPLQPPQRARSASVQLHAVAAFPTHTIQAPQARHFSDGAVPQLGCPQPGWNPFCIDSGTDARSDLQTLGSADVSHSSALDPPVFHFTSPHQAWEEMVTTTFAHRTDPPPPHVHAWEPNKPTHIHPPLVHHEAPSVDPHHNAEDDHDGHTFLCEWTDERGTCNMDIVGERVWMSHHLSRHHNVVGHERTQRACLWRGCADTMNKGSLARHVVSRHLRAGASCGFCNKVYSRADVARRHSKKCKAANGTLVQTK